MIIIGLPWRRQEGVSLSVILLLLPFNALHIAPTQRTISNPSQHPYSTGTAGWRFSLRLPQWFHIPCVTYITSQHPLRYPNFLSTHQSKKTSPHTASWFCWKSTPLLPSSFSACQANMTMPVFSKHSFSDSILSKKGLRNVPVSAFILGFSPAHSYFWWQLLPVAQCLGDWIAP